MVRNKMGICTVASSIGPVLPRARVALGFGQSTKLLNWIANVSNGLLIRQVLLAPFFFVPTGHLSSPTSI